METNENLNNSLNKSSPSVANVQESTYNELKEIYSFLSHDLKAPLRTATSFLKLLEERNKDKFDDDSKKLLGFCFSSLNKMQALVRDVSLLAQVEKLYISNPKEQFNLIESLEVAKRNLRDVIEKNDVQIIVQDLPEVIANKELMNQLFTHLLMNSIKYKSDKNLVINVNGNSSKTGFHTVSVSDNGIGIDKKFHETVFELFRRLHTSQEIPGTGIGLTLCRKITHLHGGNIQVESELNNGCKIYFTIPQQ